MYPVDRKIAKMLFEFNNVVKHSLDRYYLKYSGEASAGLPDHTGDKKFRVTYAKTNKAIYQIFDFFQIPEGYVLYVDAFNVFKALDKVTKIEGFAIYDSIIYIISSNADLKKIKDCPWENDGEKFSIPIASIRPPKYATKIFDMATIKLEPSEMLNVTGYIPRLLNKTMVTLTHNGHSVTIGKPVLPGITNKCELYVYCKTVDETSAMVQICMIKEHVYKYHSLIAFTV